ncbi:MAG TPA: TetR/AcrR family transcriptional regulator [Acidobacteriaceae bacterium]|jgi:AcrR family transcriptional regulator|nr:TetR/AcrR family transcriptional regulator [Acidobacteriaceae bacterium]
MSRPRSTAAHKKVLESAAGLFAERGIDSTSMDAIAEVSGVSKATIYKHWTDKDELCLEVLSYLHGLHEEAPTYDSGDLRADLIAQLRYEPAPEKRAMRERIMPHLIAYAARHRVFGDQWRARVMERPRTRLKQIILLGIQRNQLSADLNLDVSLAMLLGPLLYRRIFIHAFGGKLPQDFESYIVDGFLVAYSKSDVKKTVKITKKAKGNAISKDDVRLKGR